MRQVIFSINSSEYLENNNNKNGFCFACSTVRLNTSQAAPVNVKIYKYSYFLLQTLGTVSRILEQLDSGNLALEPVKF